MRRRMTAQQRAGVIRRWRRGQSARQIAMALGRSYWTIDSILRSEDRAGRRKPAAGRDQAIRRMRRRGCTLDLIAARMGLSVSRVHAICRAGGLSRRRRRCPTCGRIIPG